MELGFASIFVGLCSCCSNFNLYGLIRNPAVAYFLDKSNGW